MTRDILRPDFRFPETPLVFSYDDFVMKTLFSNNTILAATTDDTPQSLTITEQTLIGRITGGNIAALTAAQVRTLIDFINQVKATKLDDFTAPDDNTDLNATALKHGLLHKLGGGTINYLRADGIWAQPSGSGVTTWLALTDTPGSFSGQKGLLPRVNNGETALEFKNNAIPTTFVVAANDAKDKLRSDYQCDASADQTEINNAINALPT